MAPIPPKRSEHPGAAGVLLEASKLESVPAKPGALLEALACHASQRSRGAPRRMRKTAQAAQKGPDARRRPPAAREAYSLYVERAAKGANEADGPFSAACTRESIVWSLSRLEVSVAG